MDSHHSPCHERKLEKRQSDKNHKELLKLYVSKLTFKRGISNREGKDPLKWCECQIEISLNPNDSPDLAKEQAETYFQAWGLTGKVTVKQSSKTCAWIGCNKTIDPKYKFCYEHLQKVRGK